MPRLSRIAIRLSLIHLVIGFTFGALMLANKGLAFEPALWRLRPIHIELLLFGWMAQLAIGVGFWILPRFQGKRGNVTLAWLAVVLINAGLLPVLLLPVLGGPQRMLLISRSTTALAAASFTLHAWPRVKPRGA